MLEMIVGGGLLFIGVLTGASIAMVGNDKKAN